MAQEKIFKFRLESIERQVVAMPRHARILSVDHQTDQLAVWAVCDEGEELEERDFLIIGTGNAVPKVEKSFAFVGTVVTRGGAFASHVFASRHDVRVVRLHA